MIAAMHLALTIERNRRQLVRIVLTLFALVGLIDGSPVERLSRPVYRAVLRVLRPAESAVRRLIVVAARGLVVKGPVVRSRSKRAAGARTPARIPAFSLFDPQPRSASAFGGHRHRVVLVKRPEPRLRVIDVSFDPRVPLFRKAAQPPMPAVPDGTVSALRICRRLAAIKSALEDVPHQALRYARWLAKATEKRGTQVTSALRPGKPPGFRRKPTHKVDEILAGCHALALMQDTS